MEIVLARQPIFDRDKNVVAYELLYRGYGDLQNANVVDGNHATSSVIVDALINIGLGSVTDSKKAFINFTESMILGDYALTLNTEDVVIEVLEDVAVTDELVGKCKQLRELGYTIALDDFVFDKKYIPLIQQAHIIKMDFMSSDRDALFGIVRTFKPLGVKFLAEKVETQEDFRLALELGYDLFQGYFFSKPMLVRAKELASMKLSLMRLLSATSKSDFEFAEMSSIVMQDMGMTVKFLKLLNYVVPTQGKGSINSIRQGMVLIGIASFRKWLYLISMKDMARDLPDELTVQALLLAKLCEALAKHFSLNPDECFLVGLFSLAETILNSPMTEILRDIAVTDDIRSALINDYGILADVLYLCKCYISGDFNEVDVLLRGNTELTVDIVGKYYLDAVKWCDDLQRDIAGVV